MRALLLAVPVLIAFAILVALGLGCGQSATSQAAAPSAEIALPQPVTTGAMSLEEAIAKRRSIRQFTPQDLTLEQIGQLAWAAQGITEPNRGLRAAPSAGATYPLELYLVKPDGVFHYVPAGHKLQKLSSTDCRALLSGQSAVRQAPLDFVIAAVYERTRGRYGARAERYVHLEAGHVAQNIHLQAVALGLASVPVGAYDDAEVARALKLPADQVPLYIIPVGHPGGR